MNPLRALPVSIAAAALSLWLSAPAFSATVGTTGAVNPSSTGTPPEGGTRTLEIGAEVVFKERIATSESGSLQVLFLDKTTLSIGPNTQMTIDEFVYNPAAGTGSFVASIAKGSFRFVGGQIAHNSGATIKMPTATIGIRGSIAAGQVDASGFKVLNVQGNISVTLPSGQTVNLEPGTKITVDQVSGEVQQSPITTADITLLPDKTEDNPPPPEQQTETTDTTQPPPVDTQDQIETFSQQAEPPSPPPGPGEEEEEPPPPPPPPPPPL